ncbi:MAG: hypothetical protein LBU42_09520 [Prevotellaceae bacterium]|nr:hypothetical protein [Prevotellaceae bacterium]
MLLLATGCATQSAVGSGQPAVGSASFAADSLQQAQTAPLAFRRGAGGAVYYAGTGEPAASSGVVAYPGGQ